ncbi:MAG: STAS domain-containing protein [Verrucomicrobiia bacterium]|jgi:anti-anti-sigma factor
MNHSYDTHTGQLSLEFSGDVLSTNVKEYRRAAFEQIAALNGDLKQIQLDLAAANIVDSAGLNLLVAIVRRAESKNARVKARISSDHVRRTFSVTRLDQHFDVEMV